MRTISLKILTDAIEMDVPQANAEMQPRHIVIWYDPDQSIGENLENIRVKLVGVDFDAIIIENPLTYPFSDTVVGLNHQRIDIGLALTNLFNVPVVARPTVTKAGLDQAVKAKQTYNSWHLDYYGEYQGKRNFGQEAMLTIGNGYYGLRGAYVESRADDDNYPGLYVAGVYNQNTTPVNGRDVVNEDLVNLPNPQALTIGIDHANPFKIRHSDITDSYRSLDLKTGQLTTTLMVTIGTGHQMMVRATKVADMRHFHRLAIRYEFTPLNFAGSVQVYGTIDGDVVNENVARYNQFDQHHITVTGMASAANKALLTGTTKNSGIAFAICSKLTSPNRDLREQVKTTTGAKAIRQTVDLTVEPGKTYTIDKLIALFTSRESGETPLDTAVWDELDEVSFADTEKSTAAFYGEVWQGDDIAIQGDTISQKLTRVNIFHLFVSGAALASNQLDASVGARGLHGEAYRGHVFWDEMFVMPFYAAHAPKIAKAMLDYRYRRLPAARAYAQSIGKQGAMYPWQSGMKGDEQSQFVHLNPLTNQWDPDNSRRQRHVSLAVAYDAWLYWHITGDDQYMKDQGLELLLSVAKFWLSMATLDKTTGRYHISGVMGPDEYHESYPNSDEAGLTDNAYTNIMTAWLFQLIGQLKPRFAKHGYAAAAKRAAFTAHDFDQLAVVRCKLTLDVNDNGIIGQFAGYFKLPTLDFDAYQKKYGDISRIDRILKAEGKTPDAYQVAKQADTMMAYFLLDPATIEGLIADMGYQLPADHFSQNLEFYLERTTHGSTLSRIVYAVLTRMDNRRDQSWKLFHQALFSDYYDIQGGTTAEGIHLGVMGATLYVEESLYGGANLLGSQLRFDPELPSQWHQLHYQLHFQGAAVAVSADHQTITLKADQDLQVTVAGKPVALTAGQPETVDYR